MVTTRALAVALSAAFIPGSVWAAPKTATETRQVFITLVDESTSEDEQCAISTEVSLQIVQTTQGKTSDATISGSILQTATAIDPEAPRSIACEQDPTLNLFGPLLPTTPDRLRFRGLAGEVEADLVFLNQTGEAELVTVDVAFKPTGRTTVTQVNGTRVQSSAITARGRVEGLEEYEFPTVFTQNIPLIDVSEILVTR